MTETKERPLTGLKKIGEQLKLARKEKNLSLERVAEITRINIGILKNIEDGQMGEHPGPVFVKGFLKTYGELVGLDGKALLKELHSVPELNESIVLHGASVLPIENESFFWQEQKFLLLFLIIVVLAGGYFLYNYLNQDTNQLLNELQTDELQTLDSPVQDDLPESTTELVFPSPAQDDLPESTTEIVFNSPQEETNTPPSQNTPTAASSPQEVVQIMETQPVVPANLQTLPLAVPQQEALEDVLEEPVSVPSQPTPLVLLIKATLPTWINIRIDEEQPVDVSMQAGEEYSLEAEERYILTIGNTKGVELFLNRHPQIMDLQNELLVNWTLDKSAIPNSE